MMKNYFLLILVLVTLLGCSNSQEEQRPTTFTNPVIYADVPDVAVIRVESDYYMVSTTMHLMPGVPIMRSKDLVNWEIISYVVPELKDSPEYDLEGGDVYGQGQWASSLRYHDGKFYLFFATNRPQKTYIFSTTNPAGQWEKVMELDKCYHDTSLFFDEDGRIYIAGSAGSVRLRELRSDLTDVIEGGLDMEIINGAAIGLNGLLEGTQLHKHNGKYYLFMIWWPAGGIRTQVAFRSDHIEGPYEHKVILSDDMDRKGAGVAQGCMIDDVNGNWYGFFFQDRGAVGRVPAVVPCRWVDGWPIMGDEAGKVPVTLRLPILGQEAKPLVISDDFSDTTLALNWQWNHNPDNALWSLTERPGYMRLKTGKVVETIFQARNMLSQRTEGPACRGIVSLDLSHMTDGDIAGLTAYCSEPGTIEVRMEGGKKELVMTDRTIEQERTELVQDQIYLRLDCDFREGRDKATFYYSLDGDVWKLLGTEFQMVYNLRHFMGNRFGIFNYATKQAGGYVDVDFFEYERFVN